jgi:two-component system, chemotaxis family, response regulator Rcp1
MIPSYQGDLMNNILYAEEAHMNKVFDQRTNCVGPGKPIEILLVEDNPEDASLTIETLQEGRISNHVTHLDDGVPAMEFLRHLNGYAGSPRPDLILLDLKLQKMHGREVLAEIKSDPNLKQIPVVIMTTSSAEQDIFESYDLHANCYLTKPVELDEFINVVRKIEDFWMTIVKLPAA